MSRLLLSTKLRRVVGRADESQAQSLIGADSAFSDGLSLRDFADRKREVPGVF
jgi:hypothetical protein